MAVKRYLRRGVIALAAAAVFGLPAKGQAQSMNITAAMGAQCWGLCDTVRFTLNLMGTDAYIDLVRLFSTNPGTWQFGGLMGVLDQNFNNLHWDANVDNSGLLLRSSGSFGAEPMYLYVFMSDWGSASQLFDGSLRFSGQGNTQQDGLGTDISFGGVVVTPEPASMLLLGTGLAGVVAAARRRRRKDEV